METTTTNTTASSSPEFEFRNPSSHQTTLLSADQLFSDGILLPLHLLSTDDPPDNNNINNNINTSSNPPDNNITNNNNNIPSNPPSDDININNNNNNIPSNPPSDNIKIPGSDLKGTTFTTSKRWKDIFKKNPEKKDKETKKKKEKIGGSGAGVTAGVGTSTAELNINLWPFSRSRSAGNSRPPRTMAGNRKVSSAPCSRSNSTGDKHRRWPTSPGRVGVHLGRSSPVWQAKRVGHSRSLHDSVVRSTAEKSPRPAKSSGTGTGGNGKVVNIDVSSCIGYRERMGCQSVAGGNGGVTAVGGGGDGGASGLFNLRSLFTKKVF